MLTKQFHNANVYFVHSWMAFFNTHTYLETDGFVLVNIHPAKNRKLIVMECSAYTVGDPFVVFPRSSIYASDTTEVWHLYYKPFSGSTQERIRLLKEKAPHILTDLDGFSASEPDLAGLINGFDVPVILSFASKSALHLAASYRFITKVDVSSVLSAPIFKGIKTTDMEFVGSKTSPLQLEICEFIYSNHPADRDSQEGSIYIQNANFFGCNGRDIKIVRTTLDRRFLDASLSSSLQYWNPANIFFREVLAKRFLRPNEVYLGDGLSGFFSQEPPFFIHPNDVYFAYGSHAGTLHLPIVEELVKAEIHRWETILDKRMNKM